MTTTDTTTDPRDRVTWARSRARARLARVRRALATLTGVGALVAAFAVAMIGMLPPEVPGRHRRLGPAVGAGGGPVPREAVGAGGIVDPGYLPCAVRADVDTDPAAVHSMGIRQAGTRNGEPVTESACRHCGRTALDIRADAGDPYALSDVRRSNSRSSSNTRSR